jgi:hypothetical protein
MLLARKKVQNYIPDASDFLEPHDSFYIGTDVFYSFLVENKLWTLHILQQKDEYYFSRLMSCEVRLCRAVSQKIYGLNGEECWNTLVKSL